MDVLLFFLILVIIIIMIKILNKKSNKKESVDILEVKEVKKDDNYFYLKQKMMNSSEQAFYINLEKQIGASYLILPKVRIEDFVGVKHRGLSRSERFGLRNKIKSRHVDFLICDSKNLCPLLAIEIDGASHNSEKRIERDMMLDKIYKNINLEYIHIKVGDDFEEEAKKIKEMLDSRYLL
jgi:very-short-patch-repair endonuclease